LEELVEILSRLGPRARIIAGGTDLVPAMRRGKFPAGVDTLVSLSSVPGLDRIWEDGQGWLRLGARVTHADVVRSELVAARARLLQEACRTVGSVQIRNVATVVGNICNSGPSADTSAPLLALEATLRVLSRQRERMIPLGQFYTGPSQNVLEPGEVVTEILIPPLPPRSGTVYVKFSPRSHMDLAWVGVAVIVVLDESLSVFEDVRLGLSAVAPVPMRARRAEAVLKGQPVSLDRVEEAARLASEECNPNPRSRRVPAWYRREMVRVLTVRCLRTALERAGAKI
jgi:carbon-monoxide dehydrogenase medium subunit